MLKLKINLDPKLPRVIIIATLLMLVHILTKLIEILSTQRQPTAIELELFACEGVLILIIYILTFLQKEET
jgi:hypothetical protein